MKPSVAGACWPGSLIGAAVTRLVRDLDTGEGAADDQLRSVFATLVIAFGVRLNVLRDGEPHVRLPDAPADAFQSICASRLPKRRLYGRAERQCVVDGGEHRHPAVQAADPQYLRDRRPRRDEAETAPCRIGLVGDPDEGAEPAGVAEGQAGQVEQHQPGRAGDGGVALLGHALAGGRDPALLACSRSRSRRRYRPSSGSRPGSSSSAICRHYPLVRSGLRSPWWPAWVFRAEGPVLDER